MNKIRILYVEDEPFLGKIVKESLESRSFDVCWVTDGAAVMDAFSQYKPEICILDVMLPNRDGFAIGAEIRSENASIPIIFLTAKDQTTDVIKGFESGGNDYLRKPFSQEELIVRIQNLIAMTQGKSPKTEIPEQGFIIGKFRLYADKQELRGPGDSTKTLSHRENQLLQMLAAKPNAIIERKTVLQHIWGHDSVFNSRNLDVYITRLREYLKEDDRVQILTLKGVGYRLVC